MIFKLVLRKNGSISEATDADAVAIHDAILSVDEVEAETFEEAKLYLRQRKGLLERFTADYTFANAYPCTYHGGELFWSGKLFRDMDELKAFWAKNLLANKGTSRAFAHPVDHEYLEAGYWMIEVALEEVRENTSGRRVCGGTEFNGIDALKAALDTFNALNRDKYILVPRYDLRVRIS